MYSDTMYVRCLLAGFKLLISSQARLPPLVRDPVSESDDDTDDDGDGDGDDDEDDDEPDST
jgi:hypothetical protein